MWHLLDQDIPARLQAAAHKSEAGEATAGEATHWAASYSSFVARPVLLLDGLLSEQLRRLRHVAHSLQQIGGMRGMRSRAFILHLAPIAGNKAQNTDFVKHLQ